MHYRNGREAKNGDKVVHLEMDGAGVTGLGVLYDAEPGNDFCNGRLARMDEPSGACLCDCLHIDDVKAVLVAAGLGSRAFATSETGN